MPFHPFSMNILPDPEINLEPNDLPEIPLPKGWTELTLQGWCQDQARSRFS